MQTVTSTPLVTVEPVLFSVWTNDPHVFSSDAQVGYAPVASPVDKDNATSKTEPSSETVLADLYAKYAPAIYAHCRRFLQSPAAARDATQEAFVRVIARGVVLPREEEALRYLYRVSTNVCLNLLREHNVHSRAVPALAANTAHVPSAESSLADREFVTAVMERCGEGGAQVAILHYLDGMSQVDIAETLGITRRTVFNRLRKLSRIAGDLLRAAPKNAARKAETEEAKEGK